MRWLKRAGLALILALVALAALLLAAGQAGLLQGQAPADLGVREGRLKPPSTTPNSVSSQADLWPGHPQQAYARIDPLPAQGDGPATIARIAALLQTQPRVQLLAQRSDYLHAAFTTPVLRFTDDVEFWWDPAAGVVQVRSASRLGRKDLGANRARIEALRRQLAAR